VKRGITTHPKTLDLMVGAGIPLYAALGLIEGLRHFAQEHAKRGDIGRHSNASIARYLGWPGDPEALISALVECRWLDRCECHRLRIHDWHEHADDGVKRSHEILKNGGFLDCYPKPAKPQQKEQVAEPPSKSSGNPARVPRKTRAIPGPSVAGAVAVNGAGAVDDGLGGSAAVVDADVVFSPRTPSEGGEKTTWLTAYAEAWWERWGVESKPPFGELAKVMKEAEETIGREENLCRWSRFLGAASKAEFARPTRYLEGLGQWSEDGRSPPTSDKAQAKQVSANALIRGGSRGDIREGVGGGDGGPDLLLLNSGLDAGHGAAARAGLPPRPRPPHG
jgi:hypothetical protein